MDQILQPIIWVFAWIWVNIHNLLVLFGIPDGPGFGWVLSIVLLTLFVRMAIIPLYLKQIRSTRNMQVLQPDLQKLQKKYKGKSDSVSKQRQSEEMMALYKKHGSSPFSSCLPLLVQMPVLFGLYRVIFAVEQIKDGTYQYALGPLTQQVATDIDASTVFGVGLSQSLNTTPDFSQKVIFGVLIVFMVLFQFLTMQLSMKKNMPPQADPNNPMVRSQKTMMYLMPAMFIFTGLIFKMGLLIYMVTTTVFSYLQQLWVNLYMPTPGAPAYESLLERRERDYQAWAKPFFETFAEEKAALDGNEEAVSALQEEALVQVEKKARSQKVNSKFPEDWTTEDRLGVYRGLAMEPWKALPDETWMKTIVASRKVVETVEAARKAQPKKMSREQRLRKAERDRLDAEAKARREERQARRDKEKTKSGKGNLSEEEIERRRAQRRQERRKNQSKKRSQ